MKGLSLWQPWASLIMTGAKKFETRSWRTGYRGPLVIYAAKGGLPKWELKDYLHGRLFGDVFQRGLAPLARAYCVANGREYNDRMRMGIEDLPFGKALGIVDLVDCIPTDTMSLTQIGEDYPFGDFSPGRYAWKLENLRPFEKPIQSKGAQGLFHPNLDDFRIKGNKVRLLQDIWDDGCDNHHPPGYFGKKGEIVVIRDVRASLPNIVVSPENAPEGAGYIVYFDETEPA